MVVRHFLVLPTLWASALSSIILDRVILLKRSTTVVPTTSFDDYDTYWSDLYPWGTDHNGGARMSSDYIAVNDDVLTLTAVPATGQPDAVSGGENIPINYLSGTVHAKETFTVAAGGGYDFNAEFIAPTTYGTWPAFWLTAVDGWPPEIDVAEWKGTGDISFNTFNTSSEVEALDVEYADEATWHAVRAEVRDEDGANVAVKFFLDEELVTTQYAADYIGKALYLIIDLQMEGSSGSPGPTGNTTYQIRNVEVVSYNP